MKKIIKWIFYIIVAVLVILFVIGMTVGKNEKSAESKVTQEQSSATSITKPTPAPKQPEQTVLVTTATKLFNAYDENEVAVDEQVKGQLIQVSGVVQSVEKSFTGSIVIQLKTSNEFTPASMGMKDSEKSVAATLRKGQKTAVRCETMHRVMGAPFGNDCVFASEADLARKVTH